MYLASSDFVDLCPNFWCNNSRYFVLWEIFDFDFYFIFTKNTEGGDKKIEKYIKTMSKYDTRHKSYNSYLYRKYYNNQKTEAGAAPWNNLIFPHATNFPTTLFSLRLKQYRTNESMTIKGQSIRPPHMPPSSLLLLLLWQGQWQRPTPPLPSTILPPPPPDFTVAVAVVFIVVLVLLLF